MSTGFPVSAAKSTSEKQGDHFYQGGEKITIYCFIRSCLSDRIYQFQIMRIDQYLKILLPCLREVLVPLNT